MVRRLLVTGAAPQGPVRRWLHEEMPTVWSIKSYTTRWSLILIEGETLKGFDSLRYSGVDWYVIDKSPTREVAEGGCGAGGQPDWRVGCDGDALRGLGCLVRWYYPGGPRRFGMILAALRDWGDPDACTQYTVTFLSLPITSQRQAFHGFDASE